MAAKRIAQSAINWSDLAARVPPHQKHIFLQFKTKSDSYLRRVLANPPEAPTIDWKLYKNKVALAGLVDEFQKQYSALQIPYPPDTVSNQIDKIEADVKTDIASYKKESDARINEYQKQLAHLASLIPFDQMTLEDFKDSYPELALDPLNNPTFWPHGAEDRLEYVHKEGPGEH